MNPRRFSLFALFFLASVLPLAAQSVTDFGETIEVRVINVDVIVTDRAGHRIQGLSKDDFEIFQNGQKQEVTNFYELHETSPAVQTASAPSAAADEISDDVPPRLRGRKWIIFFDELSLQPFHRNALIEKTRSFLQKEMTPRDLAMVVTWNNSLQVQCPLTSDRGLLERTLTRVAGTLSDTGERRRLRRQTEIRLKELVTEAALVGLKPQYSSALGEVRAYANQVDSEVKRTIKALNSVISAVGGTEGRKILILGCESLPTIPGLEMFHFLDAVKYRFLGGEVHEPLAEAMVYESTGALQSIAANANAHDVTLYAIDPAGMAFATTGIEEMGTADLDFATGARQSKQIDLSNGQTALASVAEATGGKALVSSNNLDSIFTTIQEDLGSYYSLGYSGSGAKQDRERKVRIKVRNPAYRVRARASLVEKSLESEVREALVSNLMFPSTRNDLGLTVRSGASTSGRESHRIMPLQLFIPRDRLTLLPVGETLTGNFTVYVAFERRNGAVSKIVRQPQQFQMPLSSTSSHVGVSIPTTVDAQTERISIGVIDEVSKITGYVTLDLAGGS